MTLLDDLQLFLEYNDGSGSTASDSHTTENDGAISGSNNSWDSSVVLNGSHSLRFQGSDNNNRVDVSGLDAPSGSFSVGIFVNLDQVQNTNVFFSWNDDNGFRLRRAGGAPREILLADISGNNEIQLNTYFAGGTVPSGWKLFILEYDSSANTLKLFEDGDNEVGSASGVGSPNFSTADFKIGNRADHSRGIEGRIGQTFFYDRLLSGSEKDELWNNGDGLTYEDLITQNPLISTNSADQITNNSARLNGELEDLAEINEVVTFFQYRETSSETWLETDGNTRTSPTTFNETISSLSPDTEYEFRSVADWDDGNGMEQNFGDTLTFTTLEAPAENFQITIISTNSPVNQGQTLNVVVDVENTGNDEGTQDITLRFGTQGNIVDTQNLTVNEGQTEQITLSYQIPAGTTPDDYSIWVQSEDSTETDIITVEESTVGITLIKPTEGQEFSGFTVDFEYQIDTDGTTGTAYLFINSPENAPTSEAVEVDVINTAGVHTITHTIEDVGEDFSSSNSNTYFVRYIEDEEE